MTTFILHTTTGRPWRLVASSAAAARLVLAELNPAAQIVRIEREGEWHA
jgi:hypothetical protein